MEAVLADCHLLSALLAGCVRDIHTDLYNNSFFSVHCLAMCKDDPEKK